MSKEIKEYLEHKSNHILCSKLAAAHAAMLKAASDHDTSMPPAVRALSDARNSFHKACKEAFEEKAGFSAAMLNELEKSIIEDNLTKFQEASRKPKPAISQEFPEMFVLDER